MPNEFPEGYLTKRDRIDDPYDFRGAYKANAELQEILTEGELESTLGEIYEFLNRETDRETNLLAEPITPFVERLKSSSGIRQGLLAHFTFSPRDTYRNNRKDELIREHPVRVANLACILNLDDRTVIGLLLHDDIEDAWATHEILERIFGRDTANDVDNYSIPERPELISLYAAAHPEMRYDEAGDTPDRILKNFYKTRIQVHRLEWRGLLGKILDGISNLKDDAIDAVAGKFNANFETLQSKNKVLQNNQNIFIGKLLEKFGEGDKTHLHHMISMVNIWAWTALAIRELDASSPMSTIQHDSACSILIRLRESLGSGAANDDGLLAAASGSTRPLFTGHTAAPPALVPGERQSS